MQRELTTAFVVWQQFHWCLFLQIRGYYKYGCSLKMHFNILPFLFISFSVILGFTVSKHELEGSSHFCCNLTVRLPIRITNCVITTKLDLTPTLSGHRWDDPLWNARYEACFIIREGLYHNRGKNMTAAQAVLFAIFPISKQKRSLKKK